eukprot:1154427-Pelagomonas_calceolata.AAC.1
MAQELEHDFAIVGRMAEGVATLAHSKGIIARRRPEDLVAVTCAIISVVCTAKFKWVGEPCCGDHAPFICMHAGLNEYGEV